MRDVFQFLSAGDFARKVWPILMSFAVAPVHAESPSPANDLWDLSLEQLSQIRVVSIASGTETPLDKAAAITSVISEEEIRAMGANDLDQVLETVPGLHVNYSDQTYSPKYIFRGITSSFNPQALMLVNGIPVTTAMFGNRGNAWGGMPIKAIRRIEVIRGPGSALYGADAYAGVINIITKNARDIDATEAGVRAGEFDTAGGWVETAGQLNEIDLSLSLEYQTTDGWDRTIEEDAQTQVDQQFGTSASLAPGPVNTSVDQVEARVEANAEQWTFRAGLQDRSNIGTGPGVAQALDPRGRFASKRINSDFTYNWLDVADGLDIAARLSYFNVTQEPEGDIYLFPPGAFDGAFPSGLIGNPGYDERQWRAEINSTYNPTGNHRILSGIGALWASLEEVTERKNYNDDFTPKDSVVDVSSDPDQVWMPEESRRNYYAFIQDEWQFRQNWQLVSGFRFDHFTDFGNTINPRAALIWATSDKITTKFLYGRAFRAPSLNELYVSNNPVTEGNPDLEPESIDTYEIGLSHAVDSDLSYGINLFYYRIDDLINAEPIEGPVATRYENSGERRGYGGEFELRKAITDSLSMVGNYAFQRAEERNTDARVGDAPEHQVYARLEWETIADWQINTQINWVGEQYRRPGDDRDPVDDYTTIDLTILGNRVWRELNVSLIVRNLLDDDARSPSPFAEPSPAVPGDFPLAGRQVIGEVSYRF
ncbi:TonB-dependent receptor plug domain-containing protein [Marinobacter sp. DUT-1]|uniref:TonB-dependent receptor plug domain-containing protein n=1 Tax=Marinobacter sp. DUT-1 TaxID=3412037 RepID=UPI003D176903